MRDKSNYKTNVHRFVAAAAFGAIMGAGLLIIAPAFAADPAPDLPKDLPKSDQQKRRSADPNAPSDKGADKGTDKFKSSPINPRSATPAPPKDSEAQPGNRSGNRPGDKAGDKAALGPTAPPAPKGIAVQQPRTPLERERALANLYALLATAADETQAKSVSDSIERLWVTQGSDTVGLLMDRAQTAIAAKKPELALKFLDAAVDLEPSYTEGWSRRAYVHFSKSDVERSLGDLRRVLALDPNHYRALDGLVQILRDIGQKKAALKAARQLLEVHPYWEGAKKTVEDLAREVEGQSL
jgi:tetratricopeptide (TPR) repeat protein